MLNLEKMEIKIENTLYNFYKSKINLKFGRVKVLTITKSSGMMQYVKQRGYEKIHSLFFVLWEGQFEFSVKQKYIEQRGNGAFNKGIIAPLFFSRKADVKSFNMLSDDLPPNQG